jgi:two-component system cell cycle sensor histidine kinase/response regulator CckA
VPMHDPAGRLDGVLGVDFDANQFAKSIADAQLRALWMLAVVLLVLLGSSTLNAVLRAQIAERRKSEEALRLLGTAVEQSGESIVITDAQLELPGPKIVFVNPAFTNMTGYTAAEALGKTPRILQGPKTDPAVKQRLRDTLQRGEPFHGESVNYRKDQKEFHIEWHIAPIRNPKGVITHFVAIQRDISERKRFEQQLIQSQKLETVGKLAGGVAHEFNNIMMAIMGHADLMLHDLAPNSPLATNANVIRKAAKRVASLTRQLLAYGRRQFLRPAKLNLNDIVASMEDIVRHLVGSNVDVAIVPDNDLYNVFADTGQIEEVITNVILNAQDAMPEGGKLTLETANVTFDQEGASRYSEVKPGNYAMLSITDTGKGMTPEIKARMFEPFFSTKDIGKGTGLGLATSYGIIKQSGGHALVYSEPGKGTTFRIYLPQMQQEESQPRVQSAAAANSPRGTETILVVEDDPTLLRLATSYLERLGYHVLTATDGVEALKLLEPPDRQPVHLVFTDIVMPRMDGVKLSEHVANLYPAIKILFTSAYAEHALVHQGIVTPGMTLLEKPFSLSVLANKVRKALDAKDEFSRRS